VRLGGDRIDEFPGPAQPDRGHASATARFQFLPNGLMAPARRASLRMRSPRICGPVVSFRCSAARAVTRGEIPRLQIALWAPVCSPSFFFQHGAFASGSQAKRPESHDGNQDLIPEPRAVVIPNRMEIGFSFLFSPDLGRSRPLLAPTPGISMSATQAVDLPAPAGESFGQDTP